MMPFVGPSFRSEGRPSFLLIGESHYIPPGSTLDTSPETWYSGVEGNLSETERYFLSTSQIIEDSLQSRFSNKAHSIWRNSFQVINQRGPAHPDFTSVAAEVAFYNFFLRPAFTGESLRVVQMDVALANQAFAFHCETLRPDAIVFLSMLAGRHFRPPESLAVPVVTVPHPGCRWWNRAATKYGNKPGRELLADFVIGIYHGRGLNSEPRGS